MTELRLTRSKLILWVQILALPLPDCGQINLSRSTFPYLINGDIDIFVSESHSEARLVSGPL